MTSNALGVLVKCKCLSWRLKVDRESCYFLSHEERSKLKVRHNRTRVLTERLAGYGQQIADAGDLRRWRQTGLQSSARYPAAMLVHLYTWTHTLNRIRSATSSQCRMWRRNWVSHRSYLPRFYRTRAAALRTRCSLSVVFFGAPASRPTQ